MIRFLRGVVDTAELLSWISICWWHVRKQLEYPSRLDVPICGISNSNNIVVSPEAAAGSGRDGLGKVQA